MLKSRGLINVCNSESVGSERKSDEPESKLSLSTCSVNSRMKQLRQEQEEAYAVPEEPTCLLLCAEDPHGLAKQENFSHRSTNLPWGTVSIQELRQKRVEMREALHAQLRSWVRGAIAPTRKPEEIHCDEQQDVERVLGVRDEAVSITHQGDPRKEEPVIPWLSVAGVVDGEFRRPLPSTILRANSSCTAVVDDVSP